MSAADNLRVMASSLDEFDTFRVSHVQALIDEADAATAARDAILNDLRALRDESRHHFHVDGVDGEEFVTEQGECVDLDEICALIERHEGGQP